MDADSAVGEHEALAKLLKGSTGCAPGVSSNVGSYEYSRVSLPDSVVDGPPLVEMLPAEARLFLVGFRSRMLLPPEVAAVIQEVRGEPGCRNDPRLLRSARSYARLVRQTMKIGLTALTLRPACVLDGFFVKKKENRLRLIVDCRTANALFAPPPTVELLSGDGLSRVEVDSSGPAHGESPGLRHGCADVADCFHRMRLSREIRHFLLLARGMKQVP